jgi:hypothetical protein
MRQCTKCGETKPLEEGFYKTKYGFHGSCKECFKKKAAESRERLGQEHIKEKELLRVYNITLEEYNSFSQHCNICGTSEEGRGYKMNVDHDHKTGKVRGLLCNSCNRGLGLLGEDNLEKAILYLSQSQER